MIPIIDFPDIVKEFAWLFRHIFSYHQLKRFKQYLSGLITGRKPTIRSIASRLVEPVDQSSLNRTFYLFFQPLLQCQSFLSCCLSGGGCSKP